MLRTEVDISGLESLLSINTSMAKEAMQSAGELIKFETISEFYLGKDGSKKLVGDLKKLATDSLWTYAGVVRQFQKNRPTDFKKWSDNIRLYISISAALGFENGMLAPRWMRNYVVKKEV